MIKLINLFKTYEPKSGGKVIAIKDLNLKIPNCRLVFIVGKSGCGKSTLLNLLGGIDTPDSGKIIVFEQEVSSLKQHQLDDYRNEVVGFVFQEYNLIEFLSAKENVSLALQLQNKKIDNDTIAKVFEELDINGQEDKLVGEVSGGQKQRIAIARALIKEPQIILADEPTGALDSNTGKELMKTLKKISQERLVIVASHDIGYAKEFADRIIELSDGKVISDQKRTINGFVDTISDEPEGCGQNIEIKQKQKFKFTFLKAFRFGLRGMLKRKGRLLASMFISICALSIFGLFASYLSINEKNMFINSMYDNENYYLPIMTTNHLTEEDIGSINSQLPYHQIYKKNKINAKYFKFDLMNFSTESPKRLYNFHTPIDTFEIDESLVEKLDFQLLAGTYPTFVYEVMVSEFIFACFRETGYKDVLTGESFPINTYQDLIGKRIGSEDTYNQHNGFIVSGILDTNFDYGMFEKVTDINSSLATKLSNYLASTIHDALFLKVGYFNVLSQSLNLTNTQLYGAGFNGFGGLAGPVLFTSYNNSGSLPITKEIAAPYLKLDFSAPNLGADFPYEFIGKKEKLEENEIVVSFNTLLKLKISLTKTLGEVYNEKIDELILNFATDNFNDVRIDFAADYANPTIADYANYIKMQTLQTDNIYQKGKTFTYFKKQAQAYIAQQCLDGFLGVIDFKSLYMETFLSRITIAGIYFVEDSSMYKFIETVFVSDSLYEIIAEHFIYSTQYDLFTILTGNIRRDKKLITEYITYQYDNAKGAFGELVCSNDISSSISSSQSAVINMSMFGGAFAFILVIFASLIMFNYFSSSIIDETKKIGILRAMGAKKVDIFLIYYSRSLLIVLAISTVAIIGSCIVISIINETIKIQFFLAFTLLPYGIVPIAILFLCFVTVSIASLIPIWQITTKTPVEAIRSVV